MLPSTLTAQLPPKPGSYPLPSRPPVSAPNLPPKPSSRQPSERSPRIPLVLPKALPMPMSAVNKMWMPPAVNPSDVPSAAEVTNDIAGPSCSSSRLHSSLPERPSSNTPSQHPVLPPLELPRMLRSLLDSSSESSGSAETAPATIHVERSGDDEPLPSSTTILGKRKKGESSSLISSDSSENTTSSSYAQVPQPSAQQHPIFVRDSKRIASSRPSPEDSREAIPLILPSRRHKNLPKHRATLFPVEQIPVFGLPPLPDIDDDAILKQVFTHLSLFEKVKGKFEDPEDDLAKHYEKLEHVGDSILGMIVTTWLHEAKPGLTPGTATKLKAHLVSNATLSHLSGLYNMPQRLIADENLLPVLRASTDVRAALMEAYIAGIYCSHPPDKRISVAMPLLESWLREMYDPLFDFFYTYMKNEHDQHQNAVGADDKGVIIVMDEDEVNRVNSAATGMMPLVQLYAETYERELTWEEDRLETTIGTLFRIRCIVDGMELGGATRAAKRDAKNVAAWEAAKKLGLTTRYF